MGIADEWLAWQLDNATSLFGNKVEASLQEMEEIGAGKHKRMEPKYTIAQILSDKFRFPAPESASDNAVDALRGLPGVRVHKVEN